MKNHLKLDFSKLQKNMIYSDRFKKHFLPVYDVFKGTILLLQKGVNKTGTFAFCFKH